MFQGAPVVALIPARGGSKGLPGKNLMSLGGKSLLQRAADSARDSGLVDTIVVTSDDEAILDHARGLETVVTHRRSDAAASDTATAVEVVEDYLSSRTDDVDPWIVYLQPTSPLRTAQHVSDAMALLGEHPDFTSLVSVTPVDPKIYWTMTIAESGGIQPLFPNLLVTGRQQLAPPVKPNGALYVFRASEMSALGRFPVTGALPFLMTEDESVDIDTQEDFDRAQELV